MRLLLDRSCEYARGRWGGTEAAVALLVLMLAVLTMAAYLVRIFCGYTLCCWGTRKVSWGGSSSAWREGR